MNRQAAVLCSLAGAFIFTFAIAFAQWENAVHLPRGEAIICGLIAAAGFALMLAGASRFPGLIILDAAAVLVLYFMIIPNLESMLVRVPDRRTMSDLRTRATAGGTPVDPKAMFDEATRLYRADRFAEAVPLFQDYLHTNPNDALANARIGICLGQLNKLNDSIPYLLKASALDPTDYQSRSNLGLIYEKLNRPEEGIRWERQADKIKPNDPDVLNNLGWVLMRARDNDEAVKIFERAVRLAPNEKRFRTNLEEAKRAMR